MHSVEILRQTLSQELGFLHKARLAALWRAVDALVRGGRLWLTALGRDMPGSAMEKHRIKAIDRLLGNEALQLAMRQIYRVITGWLLRNVPRPILLVDWTGCGAKFYVLRAAVPLGGRGIPLYACVVPKSKMGNRTVQLRFLEELKTMLPEGCVPVIVTDAGFCVPWFREVTSMGWDFVGRLRGTRSVLLGDERLLINRLFRRARQRPKNLGDASLRDNDGFKCRVVLGRKPRLKGRRRLTKKGKRGNRVQDKKYAAAAKQPWLLATSLNCHATIVVAVYRTRMQIEETFRDTKSNRFGWSFNLIGSNDPRRIEMLLMVGCLATIALLAVGAAAEHLQLARHFQANTVRTRRVLSLLTLGRRVVSVAIDISRTEVRKGLATIRRMLELTSACGLPPPI